MRFQCILATRMVDPKEVFDLLADEYARNILAHADRKPMSARELADACDAHHSTIYRRIEQLQSHDLLDEELRIDPDGHHSTVYQTALEGVDIHLENGEYQIQLRIERDPVDRMAQMWREIREDEP